MGASQEENRINKRGIEEIRLDPTNINKHSERGNALTDKSIGKFGPRLAGLLDRNGFIIDGNQRAEIYADKGVGEIEVIKGRTGVPIYVQYDDLDLADPENPARELQVALHRSAIESFSVDAENLLAAMAEGLDTSDWFRQDEIDAMLAGLVAPESVNDTPPDVSKADELQKKWNTSLGQLWSLGKHWLICGDCTHKATVERLMGGEMADICFTSPPYNLGNNIQISNRSQSLKDSGSAYNGNEDDLSDEGYLSLLINFTDIALLHSRYAFVNIQSLAGNKIALIEYQHHFREHFADVAIWHKTNQQPAMANNVMNSSFEYVLMFGSEKNPTRAIRTGNFRGTFSNVYTSLINTNEFSDVHGAAFPVDFVGHFIQALTSRDGLVFEPFNGTGTTIIACENTGRQCRAIELDAGYCAVTLQRFQDATGQTPVLI